MSKGKIVLLLAILIALIAPFWAAASGALGLLTGPVALISAGLYVANGCNVKNGLKITLGFLAGNVWAYFVMLCMGALAPNIGFSPYLLLFIVLFVFVIVAVFIASYLDKIFDLSAWLSGWAVTLTIMNLSTHDQLTLLWQIAVAMVAGVWFVGVLITSTHKYLVGKASKNKQSAK